MVSEHKSDRKLSHIRASAVDLQHLRYAVAAADHGSFRRAAEVLMLQQSTLSRCLGHLAHALGMILFERSSGGGRGPGAVPSLLTPPRTSPEARDCPVAKTHP